MMKLVNFEIVKSYNSKFLKLLNCVIPVMSNFTNVLVFEKAVILDHLIFLSMETLKLPQAQLHFFK